jgi:hypothetical protein
LQTRGDKEAKWAMVMIVQHPYGNLKEMQHMVGALKAVL